MYILYERTGTFVLKRKGEKFQKEESWLLLGVTQIISCVTQTMHVVIGHPHCRQTKSFQSLRVLLKILLIFRAITDGSKNAGGGMGGGQFSFGRAISEAQGDAPLLL